MKVIIESNWACGHYDIFVVHRDQRGQLYAMRPVEMVMEEVPESMPGADIRGKVRPFLSVSMDGYKTGADFLAALAEELARVGFKNRVEEENLTSVLKAKDAHLEDMRKLVFDGRKP